MSTYRWHRVAVAALAVGGTMALALAGAPYAVAQDVPTGPPAAAPAPEGPPPPPAGEAWRGPEGPGLQGGDGPECTCPRHGRDGAAKNAQRPEPPRGRRGPGGRGQDDAAYQGEDGPPFGPRFRDGGPRGPRGEGAEFEEQDGPPFGPRFRDDDRRGPGGGEERRGHAFIMRHDGEGRGPGHRPPAPEQIFGMMDTNGDDMVSKEEFQTFHATHRPPRPPQFDGQGPEGVRPRPPEGPAGPPDAR